MITAGSRSDFAGPIRCRTRWWPSACWKSCRERHRSPGRPSRPVYGTWNGAAGCSWWRRGTVAACCLTPRTIRRAPRRWPRTLHTSFPIRFRSCLARCATKMRRRCCSFSFRRSPFWWSPNPATPAPARPASLRSWRVRPLLTVASKWSPIRWRRCDARGRTAPWSCAAGSIFLIGDLLGAPGAEGVSA